MHIALATSPMTSGHRARGIGIYTKNLIAALQKYETEHTYSFFIRTQEIPKDADIIHYPYFDPFFRTLPLEKKKPTVVTVHDLIPLVFPDRFPSGLRGAMKWHMQRWSLMESRRIITDSQNSKRDIERICRIDPGHIDVVYLAPSVSDDHPTAKAVSDLQRQLKIDGDYFLYVGDINWNKNIIGLLKGFSVFLGNNRTSGIRDTKLVLVGSAFLRESVPEATEIRRAIHELDLEQHVVTPGFVEDADLVKLYHGAIATVQPSHYEGFGLPILDAFTCLCPVVAAHNSSMSEIMGPAISVDSMHHEDIARGLADIIGMSAGDRKALIEKGSAWVRQFTWERVAEETVSAYKRSLA